MTVTLIDPDGLVEVEATSQVSVATGSKLVFVAGQVAWRPDGTTVGAGDLAAQVEQCYLNVATALSAVGASFDDVAKWTVYVVDWSLEKMPLFEEGRRPRGEAARRRPSARPRLARGDQRGLHARAPRRGRGHGGPRLIRGSLDHPGLMVVA
jgi:enamine deaminase RidA (YjgF/YER057c/UK114 family)